MSKTYPHIRRFLAAAPWAIVPEALDFLIEVIDRRVEDREPTAEEKAAAIEAASRPPVAASSGSIAVLPVRGIISNRIGAMQNMSGGTSAEALQNALAQLVADPHVSAIVLDVDSPGGSVLGIQELADAIHQATATKPVYAVANAVAGSAAYWIASQASELVVTPSGLVGSIGVFSVHVDRSQADAADGIKRTLIKAGRFKAEGSDMEPLTDEARAAAQQQIDAYYGQFTRAVARGRGVSLANASGAKFGEGRMVTAAEAVDRNMADRVATMQETIDRLQKKVARASVRAAGNPLTVFAAEDLPAPRAYVEDAPATDVIVTEPEAEDLTRRLAAARARTALANLANPRQEGL